MSRLRLIANPHVAPDWDEVGRALLAHARWLGASVEASERLADAAVAAFHERSDWFDARSGLPTDALRGWLAPRVDHAPAPGWQARARMAWRQVTGDEPPLPSGSLARRRRVAVLASFGADDRLLLEVWQRVRLGAWESAEAADHLGLDVAGFDGARKRLVRRLRVALAVHGWTLAELVERDVAADAIEALVDAVRDDELRDPELLAIDQRLAPPIRPPPRWPAWLVGAGAALVLGVWWIGPPAPADLTAGSRPEDFYPSLAARPAPPAPPPPAARPVPAQRAPGLDIHPGSAVAVRDRVAWIASGSLRFRRDRWFDPEVSEVRWRDPDVTAVPVGTAFLGSAAHGLALVAVTEGRVGLLGARGTPEVAPGEMVAVFATSEGPVPVAVAGLRLADLPRAIPAGARTPPDALVAAVARMREQLAEIAAVE